MAEATKDSVTAVAASGSRESLFERVADYVSAAMGRPLNIMVWFVLVLAWTLTFALGGPKLASGSWMPHWFTSTGFNFPLNLITTVAELFIGFLVAAAANRSERNLDLTLDAIGRQESQIIAQEAQIRAVEAKLRTEMAENYALTQQVHILATTISTQTCLLEEIHEHVSALSPGAGQFPPGSKPAPAASPAPAEAAVPKSPRTPE